MSATDIAKYIGPESGPGRRIAVFEQVNGREIGFDLPSLVTHMDRLPRDQQAQWNILRQGLTALQRSAESSPQRPAGFAAKTAAKIRAAFRRRI